MKRGVELIRLLSETFGVSGHEGNVVSQIMDQMGDFAKFSKDSMNNLIIHLASYDPKKPNVMLDCHTDEVGFLVQKITSQGLLGLSPVGGWAIPNIIGSPFWVGNTQNEWVLGVVGAIPVHFLKEENRQKIPPLESLFLDIGARSRKEVEEVFGIEIGCPIVPHSPFHYDEKTHSLFGKALDNRLGCAIMMEILYDLQDTPLPFNLVGSCSAQEEVGMRGAKINATKIDPIMAVVLESAPADDLYSKEEDQTALGQGMQIRLKDPTILVPPFLIKSARELAKAHQIPCQWIVKDNGGTNAGAIHLQQNGIPCLPISIPTRYIHSHIGLCRLEDYETTLQFSKLWLTNYKY